MSPPLGPAEHASGRRAFFTDPQAAPLSLEPEPPEATTAPPGAIVLECSRCRVRSQVGLVDFALLHLPFWLWHPGRGYTHLMTCPSCRRRAWLSASLSRP